MATEGAPPAKPREPVGANVPGPSMIQGQEISSDPEMVLYYDFVSQEEVDHLIELCEGRWTRSKTSKGLASQLLESTSEKAQESNQTYGEQVASETRTSMSCFLNWTESEVVDRISARVASVTGYGLEYVEPLVVVRYEPGQYFKLHHDGAMRHATVFLYLNDLPEGAEGQTMFPQLGFQVSPAARTAVKWYNRRPDGSADERLNHEAKPVTKGVKYGINCFVSIHKQRDCGDIKIVQLKEPAGDTAAASAEKSATEAGAA
eukprot:TRINITY_DN47693_c0_g1_i1.p1 TRINITY_DN47693_c0_g1~~TRINITY_DN47693_c0_g1_i1.p1  ORF type:complete len:278 (-),score=45.77 TRINITY_DN47693_c0_g1_i1:204-986(-)